MRLAVPEQAKGLCHLALPDVFGGGLVAGSHSVPSRLHRRALRADIGFGRCGGSRAFAVRDVAYYSGNCSAPRHPLLMGLNLSSSSPRASSRWQTAVDALEVRCGRRAGSWGLAAVSDVNGSDVAGVGPDRVRKVALIASSHGTRKILATL